jgi:hypothetical protein
MSKQWTYILSKNFADTSKKTKKKEGIPIKINNKSFSINGSGPIDLKYIESTTKTLMLICRDLAKEYRLTNLFGEPINWDK